MLRIPGVRSLFAACCIGRLPMGALGLLLILHTHDLTGSFASGGLVAASYTIALGFSNPALARWVDRAGQTLVLRAGAVVSSAAMAGFALLGPASPCPALMALAALAGAAQPPVGACMRALWPELTPSPDLRHAAYALEGVVMEVIYILGPVAIVGGIGSWSLEAALVTCARDGADRRPAVLAAPRLARLAAARARRAPPRRGAARARACASSSASSRCWGWRSGRSRSPCRPRSSRSGARASPACCSASGAPAR